jgi:hypothetical protein
VPACAHPMATLTAWGVGRGASRVDVVTDFFESARDEGVEAHTADRWHVAESLADVGETDVEQSVRFRPHRPPPETQDCGGNLRPFFTSAC